MMNISKQPYLLRPLRLLVVSTDTPLRATCTPLSPLPLPVAFMGRIGMPSVRLQMPVTGKIGVVDAEGKRALSHSSSEKAHTHTRNTTSWHHTGGRVLCSSQSKLLHVVLV